MSTVIILTPVVIGSWPAITAAVAGAAAAMGLVAKEQIKTESKLANESQVENVEMALNESEILAENIKTGQEIVLTNEQGVELKVTRDDRGRCKVCAGGKGFTKAELEEFASEFTQKLTQSFVYNRTMTELKNKKFNVVNEEVAQDGSIRINVRRWVD